MTLGPNPRIDRRAILAEYQRLGLKPISGGDQTNDNAADPPKSDSTETKPPAAQIVFTPEQQDYINRKIGEARDEGRNSERTKLQQAQDEAARKRQQEEDLKKGEHEKVIADLSTERDSLKSQLEAAEAELAKWRGKAKAELDGGVAEIKKKNPTLAELDPGDDDLFKRADWLSKAMKIVGDLTKETTPGNGPNPKPATNGGPNADDLKAELARARGVRLR